VRLLILYITLAVSVSMYSYCRRLVVIPASAETESITDESEIEPQSL